MMSGPYGDFHPNFTSGKEMIWIGGGAGMAPLRAQIMHMTKTLHTTDRELHFFYGARALGEAFFLEDFWELEKEFPNFHFHLSLDRKDPVADARGVKYYEGFAVNCIRDTYLKDHEAPEDCEYYLCGPPMLIKTVTDYLDSLGVDPRASCTITSDKTIIQSKEQCLFSKNERQVLLFFYFSEYIQYNRDNYVFILKV